jgi:glycosyltransferase involved in cell wall biosynthesis
MTYHLIGPQSAGAKRPGLPLLLAEKARASVVDFTIAVSRSDAEFLVAGFGKSADRVACILNGVGTAAPPLGDRERLARGLGIDVSARLVVTAARLSPQKGIQYAVTAMKKVVEEVPQAVLVVAGEGELEAELKALAARTGVSASVVFAGYREDVLDLVSVCDAFLLPSLWEGMPYAILEAMLLARPVVSTTISSEVVVDGETGFVVEPRDDAALARAVVKLLADPAAAARMGLAGRERLRACFSAERMAAQTLEVYERVLRKHAGRRESA